MPVNSVSKKEIACFTRIAGYIDINKRRILIKYKSVVTKKPSVTSN